MPCLRAPINLQLLLLKAELDILRRLESFCSIKWRTNWFAIFITNKKFAL